MFLIKFKPSSIIVMHNASYHSVQSDKAPNNTDQTHEDWLVSRGVNANHLMTKGQLLKIIMRKTFKTYQ